MHVYNEKKGAGHYWKLDCVEQAVLNENDYCVKRKKTERRGCITKKKGPTSGSLSC
jgi:hypothetical protein